MDRVNKQSNLSENIYKIFGVFCILFSIVIIGSLLLSEDQFVSAKSEPLISNEPHDIEVILRRHYLDGEVSEEEVEETIWSMEDFWSFYGDWEVIDQREGQIVFQKDINDISPLLKMHGYFGLTEDGKLSIYRGAPIDNEVIHSFFQINTNELKSHLHETLMEGIPISSKDQYLEVLKIYEKYAINGL